LQRLPFFWPFFGAANWLIVRWHLACGLRLYGALLGAALAAAAFLSRQSRGGWQAASLVMLAAIILDYAVTLFGQPPAIGYTRDGQ